MFDISKKIAIFGVGGLAKDVFHCIKDILASKNIDIEQQIVFVDKKNQQTNMFLGCPILKESDFNPINYQVVIAIGNSKIRKEIEQKLAKGTSFPNVIHPTAQINETVKFGKGNIFLQNVIISCDVSIGDFCVFDRVVNIGHDSKIGSHVHFSPLAVLSGNTSIGNLVEIGSHAAIKQKISIIDNSIVGMGAIVVKNIDNVGVYVGNPAKKIK